MMDSRDPACFFEQGRLAQAYLLVIRKKFREVSFLVRTVELMLKNSKQTGNAVKSPTYRQHPILDALDCCTIHRTGDILYAFRSDLRKEKFKGIGNMCCIF